MLDSGPLDGVCGVKEGPPRGNVNHGSLDSEKAQIDISPSRHPKIVFYIIPRLSFNRAKV